MVCRKFLVVFTILFDLGEIVVSKINASDIRDGKYMNVDVPVVPGSKQEDDLGYRENNRAMRHEEDRADRPYDNYDNYRDYHYGENEDIWRPAQENQNGRSGPCEILIERLRAELSHDDSTITIHNRGNVHNRVPLSYEV